MTFVVKQNYLAHFSGSLFKELTGTKLAESPLASGTSSIPCEYYQTDQYQLSSIYFIIQDTIVLPIFPKGEISVY